jgi:hypothetical protein
MEHERGAFKINSDDPADAARKQAFAGCLVLVAPRPTGKPGAANLDR